MIPNRNIDAPIPSSIKNILTNVTKILVIVKLSIFNYPL